MQLDNYVIDVLMRDLVKHEKQPSAFIVLLYVIRHWSNRKETAVPLSLSRIADGTGLSKSSIQNALRLLKRRKILDVFRETATSTPEYILRPHWRKANAT